jgi:hypothetical protein
MKFIAEDHPRNVTVQGPCCLVLQIFVTNLWRNFELSGKHVS